MKKYVCEPCGYVYDPLDRVLTESLPELRSRIFRRIGFAPVCGVGKDMFVEEA